MNNALFGRSRLVEVEAWGINALNNLALGRIGNAVESSLYWRAFLGGRWEHRREFF